MLIVREVCTAKPGQALKLAKLCKKAFGGDSAARIELINNTERRHS